MSGKVPAAVALAVFATAAAGCGAGTGGVVAAGDKGQGKQLFQQKCAGCHTLADAKAVGKVGPNLDDSFGPDARQGMKEETIRQVVADQIRWAGNYGSNGPTMPKNLVTGSDLDAVATYVAYVAGQPGRSVAAPAPPPTTTGGGGGGGGAANAAGKKAFTDNGCVSCHTLTAAGATGTVGPDLDKLKTFASNAGQPLEAFIHESIVDPNKYVE